MTDVKKKEKREVLTKIKIRKDDKVVVMTGKEKGKTGKVIKAFPGSGKLLVSGMNFLKRHVRPNRDMPQGGVIDKEMPINASNVMIYCGKCAKGVRMGIKRFPDGSVSRYCKKCELEL